MKAYAGHQFKHRGLGHFKQLLDFLQGLEHGFVIADGFGHAAGQTIAQGVVDVEFTGRPGGQEGVIQA